MAYDPNEDRSPRRSHPRKDAQARIAAFRLRLDAVLRQPPTRIVLSFLQRAIALRDLRGKVHGTKKGLDLARRIALVPKTPVRIAMAVAALVRPEQLAERLARGRFKDECVAIAAPEQQMIRLPPAQGISGPAQILRVLLLL